VNVSSLFGLIAPAGQTAYAASKFAVRGFSESLRQELAGEVGVTTVHPGGIKTRIAASARVPDLLVRAFPSSWTRLYGAGQRGMRAVALRQAARSSSAG
jgi:NAD(P)-dependent dehydrogenase (short-subunit alcohol dehydrogenase family)